MLQNANGFPGCYPRMIALQVPRKKPGSRFVALLSASIYTGYGVLRS